MDAYTNKPPNSMRDPPVASKPNVNALLSFIFGIVGIFTWLFSIPAVILGLIGLRKIKGNPYRYNNRWMAVWGVVTGIIGIFIGMAAIIWYFRFINYISSMLP